VEVSYTVQQPAGTEAADRVLQAERVSRQTHWHTLAHTADNAG